MLMNEIWTEIFVIFNVQGGWWWKSCGRGLNGLYLHDPQDLTARQGIVWFRWRGWDYTLKKATMMIRPKGPASATAPLPSTSSTANQSAASSSSASASGSGSQQSSTTTGFVSAATWTDTNQPTFTSIHWSHCSLFFFGQTIDRLDWWASFRYASILPINQVYQLLSYNLCIKSLSNQFTQSPNNNNYKKQSS